MQLCAFEDPYKTADCGTFLDFRYFKMYKLM